MNATTTSTDITLHTGDAATVIATLTEESVDCIVTSPPYWRLRDYGNGARSARQVGLEPNPADYVDSLRGVFAAARRVLTPTGTLWVNLGDSYSTNSDGYHCTRSGQPGQPRYRPRSDLPHKNLLGMPWRVALALQSDGWILRSAVAWHKPNAAPTPVRDRMACRHEMLFMLVREPDYYFDLDAIRERYRGDRALSRRVHRSGNKPHTATGIWPRSAADAARGRNPGNVWTVSTAAGRRGHPAPWPVEIPRRCIAAGCPPRGHVLDPFSGSGTTGLAARELGHRYTGVDINPGYTALAARRLSRPPSDPPVWGLQPGAAGATLQGPDRGPSRADTPGEEQPR